MDDDIERQQSTAFEQLYQESYQDLVRYGYRRTADMQLAQEIAQETFLIAWRRRAEVANISLPWLYATAWRLLSSHWRSGDERLITVPLDTWLEPACGEDPFELVTVVHDVAAAFRRLPTADQELIRLVTWENLHTAQVARFLGCSRVAAAVRLHRARQRLRRLLDYGQRRSMPAVAGKVFDE